MSASILKKWYFIICLSANHLKKKKPLNENNRASFNILREFEVGSCNNLVRGRDLIF